MRVGIPGLHAWPLPNRLLKPLLRSPAEEFTRSIGNDVSRRVLRFVGVFRAAISAGMLVISLGYPASPILGAADPELFLTTAAAYCLFALLLLALAMAAARDPAPGGAARTGVPTSWR